MTSSAVAATGKPFSEFVLVGCEGTVPGMGAGWTIPVGSMWVTIGFTSGGGSLSSGWDDVAKKKPRNVTYDGEF